MAWDENTGVESLDQQLQRQARLLGLLPPGIAGRGALDAPAGGGTPPVSLANAAGANGAGAQPEGAQPAQPGTRDYNLRVGATSQPTPPVSFVGPQPGAENAAAVAGTPPEMPPKQFTAPGVSLASPQPVAPAVAPAAGVGPGTPPVPLAGPQTKAYESLAAQPRPELHGIKKFLDVISQISPVGRMIERNVSGSPGNYDARLAAAAGRANSEQTVERSELLREKEQSAAQFDTPEKRQAYLEGHPEQFQGVTNFEKNDFVLSGKFPQHEPPPDKPKIAYHYANADGREVSVFEDGTEKVGGAAQPKDGKHAPGEVRAIDGIPDGVYGEQNKLWRANDPNMPTELKASLADAIKAHNQKFQEDLQKQREGRSVYAGTKSTNFIMPDGTVRTVNGLDVPQFLKENPNAVMTGAGAPERAMSKEAQFKEIHSGIDNARSAINNLDRGFTPAQIGKLTLAMRHTNEPTVFKEELETLLGTQQLTPAQQDLVIWLGHLNERALSIRNIAGMGQGSDSMRAAIQAVLPNLKSGSKEMMIKQLAAFENQVNKLETGVPKMPGNAASPKKGDPLGIL